MREVQSDHGVRLRLSAAAPRVGGEATIYEAIGPSGPCVLKIAPAEPPHGAWLDEERALLRALGRDPATAPLVPRVLHFGRFEGRPFVALERFPATAAERLDRPLPERLALAARIAEVAA